MSRRDAQTPELDEVPLHNMATAGSPVLDNPEPEPWPDGTRLLTIGRVTLAACGGRPS